MTRPKARQQAKQQLLILLLLFFLSYEYLSHDIISSERACALFSGQVMPELVNGLCGFGMVPGDLFALPLTNGNPSSEAVLPLGEVDTDKNPGKCFADELPRWVYHRDSHALNDSGLLCCAICLRLIRSLHSQRLSTALKQSNSMSFDRAALIS